MTTTKRYRVTGDSPIATFTFLDIVTQLGYVDFNLAETADNIGDSYVLLTSTLNSDNIFWSMSDATGGDPTDYTRTYESTTFNAPMNIEGVAYITMPMDVVGGSDTGTVELSGAILANDVELVQWRSASKVGAADNFLIQATVPRTNIKIGETLKLVVNVRVTATGAGTFNTKLGNDPANKSQGTFIFTKSSLSIPARVDI